MFLSGKDLIMYRLNKVKNITITIAIAGATVALMAVMFVLAN